ncbi:MAG: flavodoxin domain-containing protein [Treponema sp.]|nr:flavodoxin domain-containing protein [Treponema sp.]MBR6912346.1 flavodoxin domain-containing protein [Treponema sp.]
MAKTAIVYSTTTGNTEAMANALKNAAGEGAYFSAADSADSAEVLSADLILLGSPAMGAEQLDENMEVFFSGIESQIAGKKIGLFGSYDWGDGQFLIDWSDRVTAAGATLVGTAKSHLNEEPEAAVALLK